MKSEAKAWPASAVESRPILTLKPNPRNARTHSAKQVEQIAASVRQWGWTNPVLIDDAGVVLAGHGRLLAARSLGLADVPCIVARGWTAEQKRAYMLADNRLAENAGWDRELLAAELGELQLLDFDLAQLTGFDLEVDDAPESYDGADDVGEVPDEARTKLGDLWILGEHRVLCGDSTKADDVDLLMDDELAECVHADPPYGMGKEAEGVANDNLRGAKLDAFQMSWLTLAMRRAKANCGLYIWGNPADLWRLWYVGGLAAFEGGGLVLRNELVWSKGGAIGMTSEGVHSYPPETERCLFLMRGQQFLGVQNKEDYWEGYEPLRSWLCEQRDACGWKNGDINRITGTKMAGHWFSKSQFAIIGRESYDKIRDAAAGKGFDLTYEQLGERFIGKVEGYMRELSAQMRERRTFFDNTHDTMSDVWTFGRVTGEERFGHATPKPVAMIARAH